MRSLEMWWSYLVTESVDLRANSDARTVNDDDAPMTEFFLMDGLCLHK